MKRALILAIVALMVAAPAFAAETGRGVYVTPIDPLTELLNENDHFYHNHMLPEVDEPRTTIKAEFDAPNLVRFTENLTLGTAVGKELGYNLFMDDARWAEDDKGYYGVVKVTYTGSLINFSK